MITSHQVCCVLLHPLQARHWISCIVNEITQKQAFVEVLIDGLESRPVGVDIGDQQDPHSRAR